MEKAFCTFAYGCYGADYEPFLVQAAAVKMNKAKATLYPGQKVTLKVTGTSKKAKWSSSNAKVAKVSKGKVTAVKKGKATIKAKVGKKTYTCKITVKAPALSQKS